MPTLEQQLSDYLVGFKQRAPKERVAMMEAATDALRKTGIEQTALALGANLPDVELIDVHEQPVNLLNLHAKKPLIVIFYRGGWYPYCNLELRHWQNELAQLHDNGIQLIAISPQRPDNSLSTIEKNELAYPVLSDSALQAAEKFGIAFTLPPELVELYGSVGNDLPTINGNGQWVLPIPATFAFDAEGKVIYRHVESDYRLRAEPQTVIDLVRNSMR